MTKQEIIDALNAPRMIDTPEAIANQRAADIARREAAWAREDARKAESHRLAMSGERDDEQAAYEARLAKINNAMTCNGGTY